VELGYLAEAFPQPVVGDAAGQVVDVMVADVAG